MEKIISFALSLALSVSLTVPGYAPCQKAAEVCRKLMDAVVNTEGPVEPPPPLDLTEWHMSFQLHLGSFFTSASELSVTIQNISGADGKRPCVSEGSFPSSYMNVWITHSELEIMHNARLLEDPDFPASEYGQAYEALWDLALPDVATSQGEFVNTPEQREQAGQYFQVLHNGQPVSGVLWWSQGNNHKDLNFTFDQQVVLKDGDTLTLRVGLLQAEPG